MHRQEDGYALVVATILLFVMMILIVVGLDAGYSALNQSQRGIEWSRTLAVAESGVNDAMVQIGADRSAVSSCPTGGSAVCTNDDGEYQVSWTGVIDGSITIESIGYFPTKATAEISRHLRVTLEPAPSFTNALFAEDSITIKNNEVVIGDIYSQLGVTLGNNAQVCGSIVVANGDVTMTNGATTEKEIPAVNCTGKDGSVWAGGSVLNSGHIFGDAKASAPSGTTCSAASASYQITGGAVDGDATACGQITGTVLGVTSAGVPSTPPAVQTLPPFTFDPANYPGIHCYDGGTGTCGSTTSTTAVTTGNAAIAARQDEPVGHVRDLAVEPVAEHRRQPRRDRDRRRHHDRDERPDRFRQHHRGQPRGRCDGRDARRGLAVRAHRHLQRPGRQQQRLQHLRQERDRVRRGRERHRSDDGIAGLLYTTGKMAFKNKPRRWRAPCTPGAMDIKNGFGIVYNSRIASVLGFGSALAPTLWEELDPA